ncbi:MULTISPECIES: hypothetical protein [Thermomonosporaceae]|uniref:hypothetical protein n=1 Tax=Thermomonosporaceae TaxID=2012 RepID=UPI00255AB5AD|nr:MULTISPECIES: hypothetical protein [Thermomonosporaceae]MDL4775889.1 hypothetical protein [Actinomadura xylanilytica]
MTLTGAQANTIAQHMHSGIAIEPQRGDPRGIAADCLAIQESIGWHDEALPQVHIALTARQWDIAVAEIDRATLACLSAGESEEADACLHARDTILDHLRLPAHDPGPPQHAELRFGLGGAAGYVLRQPAWRGKHIAIDTMPAHDDPRATRIGGTFGGAALLVTTRVREIDLDLHVLPTAPEPPTGGTVAETSQQWTSYPHPELVCVVPGGQHEHVATLSTHIWPHVIYRVRLTVTTTATMEKHLVQIWPGHVTTGW